MGAKKYTARSKKIIRAPAKIDFGRQNLVRGLAQMRLRSEHAAEFSECVSRKIKPGNQQNCSPVKEKSTKSRIKNQLNSFWAGAGLGLGWRLGAAGRLMG